MLLDWYTSRHFFQSSEYVRFEMHLNVESSCHFSTVSSVLKLFNAGEMALAQIWIETLDWNLCRIPSLDTTTQVLDLSFNNFAKIRESVFRERNLYNLQKIFLHHCGISMVVGRCFEGITNLVEVDLSRNLLNNVPKEALRDCGYLMVLNLRGNPIRQVPEDSFLKLQELQTLDLAECQITSIQPEALTPLHNLIWLKLENNLLTSLQPQSDFPKGKQTLCKYWSDLLWAIMYSNFCSSPKLVCQQYFNNLSHMNSIWLSGPFCVSSSMFKSNPPLVSFQN